MRIIRGAINILSASVMVLGAMCIPAKAVAAEAAKEQFTVVIDAGHGGHDTGAVDNGVREKDINLDVAKKLASMIKKKMKDVKVVMTRDDDTFISLQQRANIANRNKGDLFISIHTNSLDKKNPRRTSAKGTSVYALGLHKDKNNQQVARRENSVIELEKDYDQKYAGFDPNKDESYIIFEMAQKKNLGQSLKFANEAQKELVNTAERENRGVKQAGFWVLWATSMPSVLVELDFICNPASAKFISSEKGQEKLATALFNAVKKYGSHVIDQRKQLKGKRGRYAQASPEPATKAEPKIEENIPVVAHVSSPERQVKESPAHQERSYNYAEARKRQQATGQRKRRSAASKRQSDAREIDDRLIVIRNEDDYLAKVEEKASMVEEQPIAKADDIKGIKNNKKQKKEYSKENKAKSEKPRKQDGNKRRIIVSGNGNVTSVEPGKSGDTKVTATHPTKRHTSLAGRKTKTN